MQPIRVPATAGPTPRPAARGGLSPVMIAVLAGAAVLAVGIVVIAAGSGVYFLTRHAAQPQPEVQGQPGPGGSSPRTAQAPPQPVAGQPAPQPATPVQPVAPTPPAGQEPAGIPMQRYAVTGGSINYPTGWHVKRTPKPPQNFGFTMSEGYLFYKDDPADGLAFAYSPPLTVAEGLDGQQALERVATLIRQRHPDFRITKTSVSAPDTGGGQLMEADAAWTGHNSAMRGVLWVGVAGGYGSTTFFVLQGQAPAAVFDQWRPIYEDMKNSFK